METLDLDILTSAEGRGLVERHIGGDPERLALKLRNPAVTQQIRMLQRCRGKLPGYYAARCIVAPVAYEQASSEATAFTRGEGLREAIPAEGRGLAVDLTCGLGVDSFALSRIFERVVSVEADEQRALIARENFSRLGAGNIEVVYDTAESFLEQWDKGKIIDLVYVDPSRKKADGRRVYSLEESSPNILELLPLLSGIARRIVVKLSPLFDVAEVWRLFGPDTGVEVVSVDGECKEVLAKVGFGDVGEPHLRVTAVRRGTAQRYDFSDTDLAAGSVPSGDSDAVGDARFLLMPDVGFYKARAVGAFAAKYGGSLEAGELRLSDDYIFVDEAPGENFPGKIYRITFRHPYQPKEIGRILRSRGIRRVNIHRRNFPYSTDEIGQAMGVDVGGSTDIFCTMADGEPTVFFVGRLP